MMKILIADDEVIERIVLEKKLKKYYKEDCVILVAQNGRQVLEIYEREHPQILILDIEMPVINGLEAARQIRAQDKSCSIIFLTAFDEFSYAKAAISVHALDYLLKPCDERDLLSAVDEAVRTSASQAAAEAGTSQAQAAAGTLQAVAGAGTPQTQAAAGAWTSQAQTAAGAGTSQAQAAAGAGTPRQQAADGRKAPTPPSPAASGEHAEEQRQEEFRSYIVRHYMEDIAVKDIAEYFGYSEAYFCKRFKQYFGHSFVSFLTDYRMQQAEELMRTSTLSIKEIGKAVGYPDPNYFTKVFRRVRGVSPSGFRDAGRQGGGQQE